MCIYPFFLSRNNSTINKLFQKVSDIFVIEKFLTNTILDGSKFNL